MNVPLLEAVEVSTAPNPQATIVWLHGLGADGHDFVPLVPQLGAAVGLPLRFVFPHAPVRPVSLNAGMRMRAWYDLVGLDRNSAQDEAGVAESASRVTALIRRENERGMPADRIVLAGFSQGAAVSLYLGPRYRERLAGIVALSGYLLCADKLGAEAASENRSTPIFMAHGSFDGVVAESFGLESRARLEALDFAVEWHSYRMDHAVCEQEIADIGAFLRRVICPG